MEKIGVQGGGGAPPPGRQGRKEACPRRSRLLGWLGLRAEPAEPRAPVREGRLAFSQRQDRRGARVVCVCVRV